MFGSDLGVRSDLSLLQKGILDGLRRNNSFRMMGKFALNFGAGHA